MGRKLRNPKLGLVVLSFLIVFVFSFTKLPGHTQQANEAELHPVGLTFSPSSPIGQGTAVSVSGLVANTGSTVFGEIPLRYSKRRLDTSGNPGRWEEFAYLVLDGLGKGETKEVEVQIDTGSWSPGDYEVRMTVDPDNQIHELDEENNHLIMRLRIQPGRLGRPDLVVKTISMQRNWLEVGESTELDIEIVNVGDTDAGKFDVAGFIRPQGKTSGEFLFDSKSVDSLGSGASTRVTLTLDTVDFALPSGTYVIRIQADPITAAQPRGQVEEIDDEANNELQLQLSLLGANLRPKSISLSPFQPIQGDTITINVTVQQLGEHPVGEFKISFLIDGQVFATMAVPGFPKSSDQEQGQEREFSATLDTGDLRLDPGVHTVTVIVDSEGQIAEMDEADNQLTTRMTLQAAPPRLPELHPIALSLNPPSPVELGMAERLLVMAKLANSGRAPAEEVEIRFYYRPRGGVRWHPIPCIFHCRIAEFPPEESPMEAKGELLLEGLPPGRYDVQVVIDPEGKIAEQEDNNNELSTSFALLPSRRPDLLIQTVLIQPGREVRRGIPIRVLAEIVNVGERDAGSFIVQFSYRRLNSRESVVFAEEKIESLAIGEKVLLEAVLDTALLRPGHYQLWIVADANNDVDDPTRSNNEAGTEADPLHEDNPPLFVRGPDLQIFAPSDLPATPLMLTQGEPFEVIAGITNRGIEAAGEFYVTFCRQSLEQPEGGCVPFGDRVRFLGLGVDVIGEARALLDTSSLLPGLYGIKGIVDPPESTKPFGRVEEENEENNLALLSTLQVLPPPDLHVAQVSLDPPPPIPLGTVVRVFADIVNLGSGPARGPFAVSFAWRRDQESECTPFAEVSLPGLLAGGQAVVKADLPTALLGTGAFEICVSVDADQRIREENEGNNQAFAPLVIGQPDLIVHTVTMDPHPPLVIGDSVDLFAVVRNEGDGPVVDSFEVEFALRRLSPAPQTEFQVFDRATLAGLRAGDQAVAKGMLDTQELGLVPGSYELRVTVDPNDRVMEREGGEANNQFFLTFEVISEEKADLIVTQLLIDPKQARLDEWVEVRAEIANVGGTSTGSFHVVFFWRRVGEERRVNFAQFDLENLEPGEHRTLTAELNTSWLWKGRFEILVVVDVNDEVDEVDEDNNKASEVLEVS